MFCRICHSDNLRFKFSALGEDLYQCKSCGFVQVCQEPSADVLRNIYTETYFANAKYNDQKAVSLEHRRRLALLSNFLSKGDKILDAGCSIGDFIAHAKENYEMFGVDVSQSAISQARIRNPELADRLSVGGLDLCFSYPHRFKAICLWDVIEHLWAPAEAVHRLLSCLQPGGYLFISTPAIDAPLARLLGRYWAFMTPPEHLSFFSAKSLHLLFGGNGNCTVVYFSRKGKWANLGFIGYKIGRILPTTFPRWLLKLFDGPILRNVTIYVPTGDIQYMVVQRLS